MARGWSNTGFQDVVEDSVEYQTLTREWGYIWKLRTRTRIVEIRGLSESAALTYGNDVAYYTDTGGQLYFAHFTCTVKRRKANEAGAWTVTLTKKWAAAYKNSTWQCGAAASYFEAANPADMQS